MSAPPCWKVVRRAPGILASALAIAVAATPAAAAPVPRVRGVGIANIYPRTPLKSIDADLDAAQRLGANTVRADISWAAMQPHRQGKLDHDYLQRIDRLVAGAYARHIKPLFVVLRSPCWASAAPGAPGTCTPGTAGYPPRRPADYAAFANRIVSRYHGLLGAFEVWNEPDHLNQLYFNGPDKPQRYAALLKAAYSAVKAADPRLPVLGGSLVGADGAFLEALYAEGIKGHYDGLSVHYYDLSLASLRSIRAVQRSHGDSKPVWLSEFGWTSCSPGKATEGGHACVTAAMQARNLGDVFRALRGHSWVRGAVVYDLRDKPFEHFGLLRRDGSAKPAFRTLRTAFRTGLGGPRAPTARLSGRRVVGTAPAGDVVQIQAFHDDGSFFYGVVLRTDRAGRFSLQLPGAVSNARLVVSQPWTGRRVSLRV